DPTRPEPDAPRADRPVRPGSAPGHRRARRGVRRRLLARRGCSPALHGRAAAGILSSSMLQLAGISKRYGSQIVFDAVSWSVPDGARVGLTGPNGAGKSTLLKVIAGALEPDDGQVAVPRGTLIGYLPQHIIGLSGATVLDHALAAFAELHELERRRETLEHQLATVDPQHDEYASILDRYTAVCEEWEHP